jgi:proteasomal ATPase-associated factor 1
MFSPLFPTEGPWEGRVGLIVTTEDGLPFIANVLPDGQSVQAELVGGDCDGVRAVRVSGEGVIWTAADDGIVRKYQML